MKILSLEAENIKRLTAIRIAPDGKSVVIGGDNEEGKSSALDCILYALAGTKAIPEEPLRRGADKGFTKVNLGEFIVERRVTKGGTTLVVTSGNGIKQSSPQAILDSLLGKLTFDPLAFSRMDAKAQRETLAKLVDIDFGKLNTEYQTAYESRTVTNRECDRLRALLQGKTETPGLPEKEITTADVMAKLDKARAHNKTIDAAYQAFIRAEDEEENAKVDVRRKHNELNELRQQVAKAEEQLRQANEYAVSAGRQSAAAKKALDALTPIDEAPIKDELCELGERNTRILANAHYRQTRNELKTAEAQSGAYTKHLEAILQQKRQMVEQAKFPLPGLAITDDAVTFEGLPLQQASTARQIQISTAIGMALNPKLRVMIIREGSFLDDKSLQALLGLANANDFQLWIERVGDGKETSVVIRDGEVAENRL